jgi:mono/diheme cytochrome c family protein
MRLLDIVSLFILAVLIVGALFLVLIVVAIPGKLAKKRHGPWVEAINVAGWIGEKAHLHSTARPPCRHLMTPRSHVHTNITGERKKGMLMKNSVSLFGRCHLSSTSIFQWSTAVLAFLFCLHFYAFTLFGPNHGANRSAFAPATAMPQSKGWYTPAQAANGAKSYKNACAGCHGAQLQGGMGPALVGKQFWTTYGGKKLSTLWSTVHTEMPMAAPGSVSPKNSISIMAFLLQKNGVPAGTTPLDDTVDLSKVLPEK